jgi:hypothetical protein
MLAQKSISEDMIVPVMKKLLQRHRDISGNINNEKLNPLTPQYDLTFCNSDTNLDGVVKAVKRYILGNTIYKHSILLWDHQEQERLSLSNILQRRQQRAYHKAASDLIDKYVGETEKLMRQAFEEAHEKNALLFIDELTHFLQAANAHSIPGKYPLSMRC